MTREELYYMTLKRMIAEEDARASARILESFCLEEPLDEEAVYTRLRLELWTAYEGGEMTKDDVVTALSRYALIIPPCPFQAACSDISDCHTLAYTNFANADMDEFDKALEAFLRDGTRVDMSGVWGDV